MSELTKVLSIDGGGLRGIIPARILVEIENLTGKPICELFDLMAGTSTGGIIALGLAKPDSTGKPEYTAQEIYELYTTKGKDIFPRGCMRNIRSLFFDEKYPASGIENVLQTYFRDTPLRDALAEVLIVSYDIEDSGPLIFRSRTIANASPTPTSIDSLDYANQGTNAELEVLMWKIARATTAAPTFFEPFPMGKHTLIDGGVMANNPAMLAHVEASSQHQKSSLLHLSLGAGRLKGTNLTYQQTRNWGAAKWLRPLFTILLVGPGQVTHLEMEHLISWCDEGKYYRFDPWIPKELEAMDDIRHIPELEQIAEEYVQQEKATLEKICTLLTHLD